MMINQLGFQFYRFQPSVTEGIQAQFKVSASNTVSEDRLINIELGDLTSGSIIEDNIAVVIPKGFNVATFSVQTIDNEVDEENG